MATTTSSDAIQLARRCRGRRKIRVVPLAIAIGLHLAVIVVLLLIPAPARVRPETARLTVFDAPATPNEAPHAATAPPVERAPSPVRPEPKNPSDAVPAAPTQVSAAATDGECDLTAPLQAALQASAAVTAALPRGPRDDRSVANAIMLWNTGWIADAATLDPAGLAAIRDVVAQTIAAASAACRTHPQGGPRLLILTGADHTVALAFGSGRWRWQDILDTARADPIVPAAPAHVPNPPPISRPGTIS